MASLNDLLGQPLSSLSNNTLSLTDLLEEQLSTSKVMPEVSAVPSRIETPIQPESQQGMTGKVLDTTARALWETTGLPLYSAADMALFGLPGLAVRKAGLSELEENFLTPQTAAGTVLSGIGSTAGFLVGGPMKLGIKGTGLLARPLIRKMGKETVKEFVQKGVKRTVKKAHGNQFQGKKVSYLTDQLNKTISHASTQARWDQAGKGVAKNWHRTASKAIDEVAISAARNGKVTAREAKLISDTFKKNIGQRPMQDFVDVMMSKFPNKWGYIAGGIIHDATVFGMIDAAMEGIQAIKDDRPYDWTAPIWGVLVGTGFGMLNLLPAAGKSSITAQDFKSGVRAIFKKNHFNKMKKSNLIQNAKIIGDSRQINGQTSTIKYMTKGGKDLDIDLLNPIGSIGGNEASAVRILRNALNAQRKKYGKDMISASVKEDFASTLANWKRVLLGTGIMNMRMALEMSRGAEMEPEDIMTSLLIGAFINRRGTPIKPDMDYNKMVRIRRNLDILGEPQPHLYADPTLQRGQFDYVNPLTDPNFKKLVKDAEDLGIMGNTPEDVELSNAEVQNSPSLAASQKDFPLFNAFHEWIQGASGKKYIKPKSLITEGEAAKIEENLRSVEFDGTVKNINTVEDFDEVMGVATEKIIDNTQRILNSTVGKIINKTTKWGAVPEEGELGTIPDVLSINENLKIKVRKGEVDGLTMENVNDAQRKAQTMFQLLDDQGQATKSTDPMNKDAEIVSEIELRELIDIIDKAEFDMNSTFGVKKKGLNFTFDDLDDIATPLMHRYVNKSADTFSKKFSDTENIKWNSEMIPMLEQSGVIAKDPNKLGAYLLRDFNNLTIIRPEGTPSGGEEALIKSVIGILAAKGNRSLKVDTKTTDDIGIDQIAKLSEYLKSEGISTDKDMLDSFRVQITQRIYSDVAKDTKINGSDIKILNDAAGLNTPMAHYSTLADGGTGFTISKADLTGISYQSQRDVYSNAKKWNTYVDEIIARGTTTKGKQFISPDRTISFKNPDDIRVLADVVRRAGTKAQDNAHKTLISLVKALDPTSPIRNGIVKFFEGTNNPDRLFNFLQSKGLITTKLKKGVIDYELDFKKFDNDLMQTEVKQWLSKFGVHTNDIQKMMDAHKLEVDNWVEKPRDMGDKTLSQDMFLKKYFPDANRVGTRFNDSVEVKELFDNALSNNKPHEHLIKDMEVYVGVGKGKNKDGYINGAELLKNKNAYKSLYNQIRDDVQSLLVLRNGTIEVPLVSVYGSKANVTNSNIQRTPFTNFLQDSNIPFVFVDGNMYSQYYANNKFRTQTTNVFEADSPNSVNNFTDGSLVKQLKEHHERIMKGYTFGENQKHIGIEYIRMGNAKDVVAIPRTAYNEVKELFQKEIVDVYKNATDDARRKIDTVKDLLDKSSDWTDVHEDAMRSLIVNRMVRGKGTENKFLDFLTGTSKELADLGKRFSLYHTPSFKRLDKDLVSSLVKMTDNLNPSKDKNLLKSYLKRDIGMIVWNDEGMAGVFDRNKDLIAKKKTSIKKMLGNSREDASSFDSISFISKDFKRMLELYYGVSSKGSNIFKPIISSGGDDYLFLGKTVFVHDPDIEVQIMGKHKGLDILTTRSADKMKSAISDSEWASQGQPDRIRYIDKTVDEMLNITESEISTYMKTLKMKNIGITTIPDKDMLGKQSYSQTNFMNNDEVGSYFDTFYASKLDKVLGTSATGKGLLQKLTQDSAYKKLALLKLKSGEMNNSSLDELAGSPESLKHLGHHLQIAAMGGDVRMLGEDVLINTLKSQFLDPIISPQSITDLGEIYGGKAVIKQSFNFRDLQPTARTGDKGNTKINPGDIMLPYAAREGAVSFKDADLVMRAIDKNGKVTSLKDVMIGLWKDQVKKGAKIDPDKNWDALTLNGNLGQIHDTLKRLSKDYSVGVITTRYPRTAPNDMAILKLKDFLPEDHGQTAIVNDFDVMNIFEGDYDVDEVDYFWGQNNSTWGHIDRVKQHWVNTKDVSLYEGSIPDLALLTGKNNDGWKAFDANNRVFKKGIGLVQKTPRLLQHIENIGIKDTDENSYTSGMSRLIKYQNKDGETVEIALDYDNSSFFERTALESQLVIDYWKGVNKNIAKGMVDYRNDYLFPRYSKSVAKEDVASFADREKNHKLKGPNNIKIRLFRKFVDGKESVDNDLNSVEKGVLQSLMTEHSKFLALTSDVYDSSGGRTPTYNDLYSISQVYFKHMDNINNKVFAKIKNRFGMNPVVKAMFKPELIHRASTIKDRDNYIKYNNGKALDKLNNEIASEEMSKKMSGKRTYMWHQDSPFLEGVIQNAQDVNGGKRGTLMERFYNRVYKSDPFGNENTGKVDIPLSSDLYIELQSAASELLSNHYNFNSTGQIKDILPKFTKVFNEDVKIIKYYKRLIGQISSSKDLKQDHKAKRIASLKEIVKEKETTLKELLPKKYLETGEVKYLESLKTVDITRDQEIVEATTQWYTLFPLVEKFTPDTNLELFYKDINDAITTGAELYNERSEMGSTNPYKWRSIHNAKQQAKRIDPKDDFKDIETEIDDMLQAGFDKHDMPFLLNYAMPTTTETTIGMYKNIPLPISVKPTGRLKRTVKFMLNKINESNNKVEVQDMKEALEQLVQRYSSYRNFFDGNFDMIPLGDTDMMQHLNNAPGFSTKLRSVWDRYESIKIDKGTFAQDVFGMGPEYENNLTFYRRLLDEGIGNSKSMAYRQATDVISKTNQLAMENKYMDPISYMLMMKGVRQKLSDLGLDKAEQMGVEGGENSNINIHARESNLAVLAGRRGGISIKPMAMLSDYRMGLLRRFIKQGQDIKKHNKSDQEWDDYFKQEEVAGKCKPGKV